MFDLPLLDQVFNSSGHNPRSERPGPTRCW
jgi:hypothetical protein